MGAGTGAGLGEGGGEALRRGGAWQVGASSESSPYKLTFAADGLLPATMSIAILAGYPSLLDVCASCAEGACVRPGFANGSFVPPAAMGPCVDTQPYQATSALWLRPVFVSLRDGGGVPARAAPTQPPLKPCCLSKPAAS